jgi:hypothetical protein
MMNFLLFISLPFDIPTEDLIIGVVASILAAIIIYFGTLLWKTSLFGTAFSSFLPLGPALAVSTT